MHVRLTLTHRGLSVGLPDLVRSKDTVGAALNRTDCLLSLRYALSLDTETLKRLETDIKLVFMKLSRARFSFN